VSPKWRLTKTVSLEEEDSRGYVHALDEVLADEEAADGKSWTGAYPPFNVGPVFLKPLRQLDNSR
jgi:hypothetical protein